MEKLQKEKLKNIWKKAMLAIIPFLIFAVQEWFYKYSNQSSAKEPEILSHIMGYAIMCGLFFLFLGIFKTSFRAAIALCVFVTVIMVINQFKIVYSSNPVFIRDIGFLSTPDTFTDILKENVGGIIQGMIKNVLKMAGIFAAVCVLAYKSQYTLEKPKYRIISAGVSVAFFLVVFLPIKPVNNFFIGLMYEIDEKKNNNTVSNTKYYYQHSVFGGMVGEYLTTILKEPDDYDKASVEKMYETGQKSEKGSFGRPNIIMVFSESLFDVTVIDEVEFNVDVASNFHELSKEGMLVNMISPSFGGISCNPEFEMLTGGSIRYFPENYIPYMNLYNNDKYEGALSYIGELNKNGYTTHITSCWGKSLFNVKNVYRYFDVQETEYITSVDKKYKKGGRISDDFVAETIIDAFEKKDDDPLFYMVLTAQNHMPFTETKYDAYNIEVTSTKLNEEETGMLKSYAQGVYDADLQLRKLYDYIQTLEEPTMLIYYGDHLPFLKSDAGDDLYEKLSYFNTDNELTNTYRMYNTQCLILDNFDAKYDDISYLGYDLVMSYITNNMDIELSPYYKWLYTTIDALPAANRHVAVDSDGNIYSVADLPKAMDNMYKKRQLANWNIFVDID